MNKVLNQAVENNGSKIWFVIENPDKYDFFYISPNSISAWEHSAIHEIKDIEKYVFEMMPIKVKKVSAEGYIMASVDGNHRVNTLQDYNAMIPVYAEIRS